MFAMALEIAGRFDNPFKDCQIVLAQQFNGRIPNGPCRSLPFTGGDIIAFPQVGGLHHRYERRAA
jgi:hypothetical protein